MTRTKTLRVILGLGTVIAAAALAKPAARWLEPTPSLAEVAVAVHGRDFDAAQRGLSRLLASNPGQREANLLMAQVLIDRPNPKPAAALDHLARLRTRDAPTRAAVSVLRGKALYLLSRFAESERAWREALALDPTAAEAGWLLIQQYYLQGRAEEARRLALALSPAEDDPIDRVRYLLELSREDVERLSATGVIPWLEPAVKADPGDRRSALALGLAYTKEGRLDEGLTLLRKEVSAAPEDLDGWLTLLEGLADAGEVDALAEELSRVPPKLGGHPGLASFRGRVAQERRDPAGAAREYAEALKARPFDAKLLYRMSRALRQSGKADEAKAYEAREADVQAAQKELADVYQAAAADKTFGARPDPALYQRFAGLRERLGRSDEALAWHRLVLRDDPKNPASRAAVRRLGG